MIYLVEIDGVKFHLNEGWTFVDVCNYCELKHDLNGRKWKVVRESYDFEELEEFLSSIGVILKDFDDD